MKVEVTKDIDLIKDLMSKVWAICVADNEELDSFSPRTDEHNGWLIVKHYDNIEGIVFIEQPTTTSIKIHPYLLGEKGKGRELVKSVLGWAKELKDIHKVNITIPVIYQSTINTARKIGFIDEGIDRESFLKDGHYHDQSLLGLTRPEIEALL